MTTSDYLIDISLIAMVLLQVRGRRLTLRGLLLPVGIVAYVANKYLHGIPTAGNDVILIGLATAIGITLGALAGRHTTVGLDKDGNVFAKAGFAAAALWILGTGTRLAFQLYATYGGGASIVHFSAAHDITSIQAWVGALILMALGEALARTAVLAWRAYSVAPERLLGRPSMMATSDRSF